MNVATSHVFQRTGISIRPHHLFHFGAGIELDLFIRRDRLEFFEPGTQGLFLPGVAAEVAIAKAEIGVDGVLFNPLADNPGTKVADLEDGF
ncbi:hypothetical protein D3C80_1527140 [compost metagenome]